MTDGALEKIGFNLSFGGQQLRFRHRSEVLNCDMTFSIYLPPQSEQVPVPVLYWLSGLTCTDENFVAKAVCAAVRGRAGYPPLFALIPVLAVMESLDDPDGAYDFGLGAGFYVNATEQPWSDHYQMYDYVLDELPGLINSKFPVNSEKMSISGHSMGRTWRFNHSPQ